MAVATDTRAVGADAAIAIGGTVGLDALFGGPVTGAAIGALAYQAIRGGTAGRRADKSPVSRRIGPSTPEGGG